MEVCQFGGGNVERCDCRVIDDEKNKHNLEAQNDKVTGADVTEKFERVEIAYWVNTPCGRYFNSDSVKKWKCAYRRIKMWEGRGQ